MTALAGTLLGPYELQKPIGAGGMGEVWRARDTRLQRDVAVKVLPARFSEDAVMRERFEREARTISQLSHPNICAIFDVGSHESTAYLVMELLEGESLAERLARGPLPRSQALRVGRDVCAALAAAHRKGIVHRDVKPANVFLSAGGTKLLDFGLAKLRERAGADASQLPTRSDGPLTGTGAVVGTLAYMAPEQLEGKTADARTDLFALGSVLFEMVTGSRPFKGDTQTALITAILTAEPPPLSALQALTPASLDRAVRTCLAKDPEERWQSAADLGRELSWIEGEAPLSASRGAESTPRPRRRDVLWGSGLLLAALVAFAAGSRLRPRPDPRALRFSVPIPPGTTFNPGEISRGIAVSPDGTRLVIVASSKGQRRLFVRPLDADRAVELPGTDGAGTPFWSPDGRFLAFYGDGKLKKIPAGGGAAEELCATSFDAVGSWGTDGTILFGQLPPVLPAIYRVSDKGGTPAPVTTLDAARGEKGHLWPHFLPGGRRFLYSSFALVGGAVQRNLWVSSLDSHEKRVVATMPSRAEYAPPGYLLFARDAGLYAQRFDARRAELSGEPRLLADDVRCFFGPGNAPFSVSQNGVVAYQAASPPSKLRWLDRDGKETGALGEPAVVNGLRIAPDGARVAVALEDRRTGTSDVWVFDASLGVSSRLHSNAIDEKGPVWSPDGARLTYRSDVNGPPDIFELTVATPGSERPLLVQPGVQQPEDISPDGRYLVYANDLRTTSSNIGLLPLTGERTSVPWLVSRFRQASPRFSPDGRWIAYESDESGEPQIYVALREGGGEKRRLSPSGGRMPRWRRDGKELTYAAPDGSILAVPLFPGPAWKAGPPARLFHVELPIEDYDVTADGSRFLVQTAVDAVRESPLRVIVNWPALLDAR